MITREFTLSEVLGCRLNSLKEWERAVTSHASNHLHYVETMTLSELKALPIGTYAAVRVLKDSNAQLSKYVSQNKIPVRDSKEHRRHVTLLYSRVHLPTFKGDSSLQHTARPVGFELFDSTINTKCLVILLSAPTLEARFRQLMSQYPATYDFPTYRPHITLSYDVGADFDIGLLPAIDFDILLGDEYVEDLKE